MANEYLLVLKQDVRAVAELLDELRTAYAALLERAGELAPSDAPRLATTNHAEVVADKSVTGKYIISRGGLSYADVVDREVLRDAFSVDEALEVIRPKIFTRSQRVRESLKRALDTDSRFFRSSKGVYIRRNTIPNSR